MGSAVVRRELIERLAADRVTYLMRHGEEAERLNYEERVLVAEQMEALALELTAAAMRWRQYAPDRDWIPPFLRRGGPPYRRPKK